jgi:hypothetical protein
MYASEVPAVSWQGFVLFAVLLPSLLTMCIWALWKWDVGHESDFRLPKRLEPRIKEFVRAVDAWDFEAAETAVTHAFWLGSGDPPKNSHGR